MAEEEQKIIKKPFKGVSALTKMQRLTASSPLLCVGFS
jgi:hypothetical protein